MKTSDENSTKTQAKRNGPRHITKPIYGTEFGMNDSLDRMQDITFKPSPAKGWKVNEGDEGCWDVTVDCGGMLIGDVILKAILKSGAFLWILELTIGKTVDLEKVKLSKRKLGEESMYEWLLKEVRGMNEKAAKVKDPTYGIYKQGTAQKIGHKVVEMSMYGKTSYFVGP
jgi:hypothetical protein